MATKKTRVISVALRKGGVGKTTTVQHLAHLLALRGRQVLMLDMDPQGSLSSRYHKNWTYTLADVFGVGKSDEGKDLLDVVVETHEPGLHLTPGGEELSKVNKLIDREMNAQYAIDRMLNDNPIPFDYVVIDTPPGESALLLAALIASDDIIVPVHMSPMGIEGFAQIDESIKAAREAQLIRGEIRLAYRAVVPTFYGAREDVSKALLEYLQEAEHPDYKGVPLPLAPPIEETTHFKKASARRQVGEYKRALMVWEQSDEEIVERASRAYASLAAMVEGAA